MQVMEEDKAARFFESGEWFKHPSLINGINEVAHEEPIRQQSGQRRKDGKRSSRKI
jgi:hypothetical protein